MRNSKRSTPPAESEKPVIKDQVIGYLAVRRVGDQGHKGTRQTFFETRAGLEARLDPERNAHNVWKGFELTYTASGALTVRAL